MDEQITQGEETQQVETAEATAASEPQVTETQAATEENDTEEYPGDSTVQGGHKPIRARLSELTARAKAAEYKAQFLEDMIRQQQQPQTPAPQAPQKPTREQFDYDEDRFLEALADYKVQEKLTVAARAHQERLQRQHIEAQEQEVGERKRAVIETGASKWDDFEEKVAALPHSSMNEHMAAALSLSDIGADIAYHLANHPQEAARIGALSPYAAAMEIGRLETKLKTPAPKKMTAAPPPIDAVGARGQAETDPDKMTANEWRKWREAQLRR